MTTLAAAPADWWTTAGLLIATVAGAAGCAGAIGRVLGAGSWGAALERAATLIVAALSIAVFCYRTVVIHQAWAPLTSHVDGLTLLAALLATVLVYLQWSRRLPGVSMFALPLVTLLLLWGVCASWWTLREYQIQGLWDAVHLVSVYVGSFGVAAAAAAGGLWLYVDRQLRRRDHAGQRLRILGRLADLESVERAIRLSATIGFLLITIGLVTGLIITMERSTALGPGWWYSPKVLLAVVVWAIYFLVMEVQHLTSFRGRPAAVLSIIGFVLLLGVLMVTQVLNGGGGEARSTAASQVRNSNPEVGIRAGTGHPSHWRKAEEVA